VISRGTALSPLAGVFALVEAAGGVWTYLTWGEAWSREAVFEWRGLVTSAWEATAGLLVALGFVASRRAHSSVPVISR
jgi:hypothetical protein